MKKLKIIVIIIFWILIIVGTTVFANTGIVNAPSGLVLRKEANKQSAPIATVSDKAEVNILEKVGEWYKVTYNSQEGYLFSEYVTPNDDIEEKPATEQEEKTEDLEIQESAPEGQEIVQTINKIKVYNIPLISSTVINEIEPNTNLTIHKQITNWSYISTGTIKGWIRTYMIENNIQNPETETSQENIEPIEPQENSEPIETPENQEQIDTPESKPEETSQTQIVDNTEEKAVEGKTGTVNVDYANVRKETSTTSEIVTTLTENTTFKITAETDEWYKIKYEGENDTIYEGYIFKELITINN